jgi:hypothetical protein
MREDDSHSVWLHLACGLARIGRSELDSWPPIQRRPSMRPFSTVPTA